MHHKTCQSLQKLKIGCNAKEAANQYQPQLGRHQSQGNKEGPLPSFPQKQSTPLVDALSGTINNELLLILLLCLQLYAQDPKLKTSSLCSYLSGDSPFQIFTTALLFQIVSDRETFTRTFTCLCIDQPGRHAVSCARLRSTIFYNYKAYSRIVYDRSAHTVPLFLFLRCPAP
jgi:hypothetical protein